MQTPLKLISTAPPPLLHNDSEDILLRFSCLAAVTQRENERPVLLPLFPLMRAIPTWIRATQKRGPVLVELSSAVRVKQAVLAKIASKSNSSSSSKGLAGFAALINNTNLSAARLETNKKKWPPIR